MGREVVVGESAGLAERPQVDALAERLVSSGKLSSSARERAVLASTETGERFECAITRLGLIGENDLTDAIAELLNLPKASRRDFPDTPILTEILSARFLRQVQLMPIRDTPAGLSVAVVNPLDSYGIDAVRFATGRPIVSYVTYPADFEAAYARLYGNGVSEFDEISQARTSHGAVAANDDVERLEDHSSDAPVIRLVNLLISRAVEMRASDIHVEPMEGELRVRYRIDGILHSVEAPPYAIASAVVSRIKLMARLNIAERRLAQDGRIKLAVRGKDIDFRVSTTPTMHGESVVLRILDRSNIVLNFSSLGFESDLEAALRGVLDEPHGIVLVTGPTGSGKTTTLYTALLALNTPEKKILSIEDPIEYQLQGVNQVQVKPQIGLTFAGALRSFLRQDPDIMMVGEIRDLETAQIAIQAALTGHLILSSLHTNDATSAITRFLDMGVEDYLLTSTVTAILGQRLVRLICRECKEGYAPFPELLDRLQIQGAYRDNSPFYRPVGCQRCGGTGYSGRTSIIELLPISDAIRQLILKRTDAASIRHAAIAEGMQTMFQHGMKKVLAGLTSVDEVVRVTRIT